jgi:hypothetical protein
LRWPLILRSKAIFDEDEKSVAIRRS